MDPFGIKTTPLAVVVALALAVRAQKRKNLTPSGAFVGCLVGFLIVASGLRGMNLFFFYQIGSFATKYKKLAKEQKDATMAGRHARGGLQVLAVAVTPVVLSLLHVWCCGKERPVEFVSENDSNKNLASSLTCAVLAHHATCLADTLASELGILSQQTPILITQPWRSVPAGTNGGVTILGTFVSLVGGVIIGALAVAMDFLSGLPLNAANMVLLGGISGLVGSLADSLIGAILQSSYYDTERKLVYHANSDNLPKTAKLVSGINLLTNEQVNFVSGLITSLLGGWVLGPLVFGISSQ